MEVLIKATTEETASIASALNDLIRATGSQAEAGGKGLVVVCVDPTSFESGLKSAALSQTAKDIYLLSCFAEPVRNGVSHAGLAGVHPLTKPSVEAILIKAGIRGFEAALEQWWKLTGKTLAFGPDASGVLRQISMLWQKCHRANFAEGTNWSAIWPKHARDVLLGCMSDLAKLSIGKVNVQKKQFTLNFWKSIFSDYSSQSVTTTNLSAYNGSFGRSGSRETIEVQRRAIKRDPPLRITRIFIYDPDSPRFKSELVDFRRAMLEQSEIGIRVRAIPLNLFRSKVKRFTAEIGSEDFMLLDERLVYITTTNEDMTDVDNVTLVVDDKLVSLVKEAFQIIERWSDPMDAEDIHHFPDTGS